jgi:hypothetical protein
LCIETTTGVFQDNSNSLRISCLDILLFNLIVGLLYSVKQWRDAFSFFTKGLNPPSRLHAAFSERGAKTFVIFSAGCFRTKLLPRRSENAAGKRDSGFRPAFVCHQKRQAMANAIP